MRAKPPDGAARPRRATAARAARDSRSLFFFLTSGHPRSRPQVILDKDDLHYVADVALSNLKLIIGFAGVGSSGVSHAYPASFPKNWWVLLVCCAFYFITSGILQARGLQNTCTHGDEGARGRARLPAPATTATPRPATQPRRPPSACPVTASRCTAAMRPPPSAPPLGAQLLLSFVELESILLVKGKKGESGSTGGLNFSSHFPRFQEVSGHAPAPRVAVRCCCREGPCSVPPRGQSQRYMRYTRYICYLRHVRCTRGASTRTVASPLLGSSRARCNVCNVST